MKKHLPLAFLALSFLVPGSCRAQGMIELKGLGALSAGAGAAAAAAATGGSKTLGNALNAATMRLGDINKYVSSGDAFEKKKDWPSAEKDYRVSLRELAKLGKTDTPQALSLMEKLSRVCLQQHKTGEAIGFYKTVVTSNVRHLGNSNPHTIECQQKLADMYEADGDLVSASKSLGEAVGSAQKCTPALPQTKMLSLLDSYSNVLRKEGRSAEAESVTAQAASLRNEAPPQGANAAGSQTSSLSQNAAQSSNTVKPAEAAPVPAPIVESDTTSGAPPSRAN